MQKTIQTTTFHTQIALSRRINLTLFVCLFLVLVENMNDREMKTRKRCEYFIFLMPTVHNWLGPFIFKNRTRLDSGTTYYMYLYCHCKTVFDGRNKPEMGWNLISQTNPNRSEPVFIRFEIRSVPSNYDATSVQSTDWRPGFEIWKSRFEFRTG